MRTWILTLVVLLAACGKPQDTVFGPDPLKQIVEQRSSFKWLSDEDHAMLVAYLSISQSGKAIHADAEPATGRTVAEVLADARAWNKKSAANNARKNQEEEAEAQKAILAEHKVIADRIRTMVTVTMVDKTVVNADRDAKRTADALQLIFAIENKSDKAIRKLTGSATFVDASGKEIGWLRVNSEEPVAAGATLITTTKREWKIIPHWTTGKIATQMLSSLQMRFEPWSVSFDDGSMIASPQLVR